jgi:hypothetical protein
MHEYHRVDMTKLLVMAEAKLSKSDDSPGFVFGRKF